HLTLQQTKAISKSDLALGSHVNKDDLQGRERAWTTTDVRPRVGPTGSSRPSTAGAKPTQNKDGLTIDIIQTMPTPTDGPVTPLRNPSPIPPSPTSDRQSLQSRRRCASNPLRIDAKGAQEKALSNDSYDGHSKESPSIASHSDKPSQQSHSRPRKPSTPTGAKGEPSSVLLHRITTTPPNVAPVINLVAPSGTPFTPFLSVSSNGNEAPESPSPTHSMPVPNLPSAVDLHNMHLLRAKEEAKKLLEGEVDARPTGTWNGSPPVTAGERRLGIGSGRRNDFGYDSVRSFNEEKGGERLWQPPTTETGKSTKSKLG
ncbi:13793_t:CDS:1, partial [Acaulospora colombiana]